MVALCAGALAGVPDYRLVGAFELPAGAFFFDAMPDGRVVALVGNDFWMQDAVNGSAYTRVGSLAPGSLGDFGASFLRVSRDGSTIAVGDGRFDASASVLLVGVGDLSEGTPSVAAGVLAPNYDAHWDDLGRLWVTGAGSEGSVVTLVDNARESRGGATATTVVANIGGASSGVTTAGGWLFTANGFDVAPGGSETGEVRAFSLEAITRGAAPLDFEREGVPVADALSGGTLGFDRFGNLLIGGGDFLDPMESGYVAVVDGEAINAALLGAGIAPDPSEQRLSPAGGEFFGALVNSATEEALVSFFGGTTVFRYAIPAPSGAALAFVALGLTVGRRRDA